MLCSSSQRFGHHNFPVFWFKYQLKTKKSFIITYFFVCFQITNGLIPSCLIGVLPLLQENSSWIICNLIYLRAFPTNNHKSEIRFKEFDVNVCAYIFFALISCCRYFMTFHHFFCLRRYASQLSLFCFHCRIYNLWNDSRLYLLFN